MFEVCIPKRRSGKPPLDVARPRATAGSTKNQLRRNVSSNNWIAAVSAAKYLFSRKERKDRKEMEGGNGANAVSGITLL